MRQSLENSAVTGATVSLTIPAAFCLWRSLKKGDSSRLLKMNQPSSELSRPEKNMQRHPHTAKASPGKIDDVIRKANDARSAPIPAPPPPMRPDMAPRRSGETDSVRMVWSEATTPPTKTP